MPKFTLEECLTNPSLAPHPRTKELKLDNGEVVAQAWDQGKKVLADGLFVGEYKDLAKRTESLDPDASVRVLRIMRLLHGSIGLVTEAGEFQDALKKHIFYGKPLDEVNLMEEVGDFFWYIAIILDVLGYDWVEVMKLNIEKLVKRYPDKFDAQRALIRDLLAERAILEGTNVADNYQKA